MSVFHVKRRLVALLVSTLWACGDSDSAGAGHAAVSSSKSHSSDAATVPAQPDAAPRRTDHQQHSALQWKRGAALEADLARALELTPDSVCREFGTTSCIREVHLVPLGGSNPFTTGLYEPAAEPLASTPTVVDRVVLSACAQRVELDRTAGSEQAEVFRQFSLNGDAPAPEAESSRALVRELFQRLLSRDPQDNELETITALARDEAGHAISAGDFAKLACFSIGSSAEFLFF